MFKYAKSISIVHIVRHHHAPIVATAFALAASLVSAGCSSHEQTTAKQVQTQSGITASIDVEAINPDGVPTGPAHSGDNTVFLDLSDSATGHTIGDATVTGTADMDAPKIAGQQVSGRDKGNGRYEIPVRFGIAAKYDLRIEVSQTGQQPVDFDFPVEVLE